MSWSDDFQYDGLVIEQGSTANSDQYEEFRIRRSAWPELVGDNIERASAQIRWWGPHLDIELQDYKESKRPQCVGSNPRRVILYLDSQGFVAVTPRVG